MHNKKIIAKGIIVATALSNAPVDSLANTIEEYKLINMEDNAKENKMGDSIKNLFAKIVEPIENLISEPKEVIKVNKNIVKSSVLEISLTDGEFVPNLVGNPSGYETVKVITVGSKKLVKADYDNLRLSGIPKIDLSSANSDSIPTGAFTNATHLTEFKFPQGITSIGEKYSNDGAFKNCRGLTGDLIIPEGVTSIGYSAFYGCSGLTGSLIIPEGVISIEYSAFYGCSGLTGDLIIPEGVTSIGESAFRECSGFDGNLVIPNSVTSIEHFAFYECSGLTGNLVIPEGVINISNTAFYGCDNIEKILIKVNSSNIDTNYKKNIIDNLPDSSKTVIDIPYDFDITGTWLETTRKTVVKPVIKNIIDEAESDLIDLKGEKVSLYIPSLYKESNVTVLKDGEPYTLPTKNRDGKHIFTESGVYELTVTTDLGNTSIINFEVEDPQFKNAEETVKNAEQSKKPADIETARDLVNQLPECSIKDQLQDRLDEIFPNLELERKTATANLDIYIKCENMLSMSLDTNSVSFEEYSGAEPIEKLNAVNININSSLPYTLNAYLPNEIQNSDGSNKMDLDILNIRENSEAEYKQFENTTDKLVLKDSYPKGNNINHVIDLKLDSHNAHKADVYKTVIKFEVVQK